MAVLVTEAKPRARSTGCKPAYPQSVLDGLLDLRVLRIEEERIQLVEDTGPTRAIRTKAKAARNALEAYLDARIDLMATEAESHQRRIRGQESDLCRCYDRQDDSIAALRRMATERANAKAPAGQAAGARVGD